MKRLAGVALAVTLVLAVTGAWAEEIRGKVATVDVTERVIVFEDGTKVWVAEGVSMEIVKEGATVKASAEEREGKKVATTLETAE